MLYPACRPACAGSCTQIDVHDSHRPPGVDRNVSRNVDRGIDRNVDRDVDQYVDQSVVQNVDRKDRGKGMRPVVAALAASFVLVAGSACSDGGAGAGSSGSADESAGRTTLADSTLDAWIERAGGLAAWDSVRTLRYTVTTALYDSTGAVDWVRPRRVAIRKTADGFVSRIERPEGEGLYVQAFAGDTGWATLNDHPLPPDHPAVRETEYVGRDVYYWIGLPYKLRDPGVNAGARRFEAGGAPLLTRDRGGVEVRVTFGEQIGQHPGDRYFYYFLDDDPFPEEAHYIEEGGDSRNRMQWRDFRDQGPITYVGTRHYENESRVPTKQLRIDDVVVNPELPDGLFRPPETTDGRAR